MLSDYFVYGCCSSFVSIPLNQKTSSFRLHLLFQQALLPAEEKLLCLLFNTGKVGMELTGSEQIVIKHFIALF